MLKLFSLIKSFLRGGPEGRPKGPMVGQGEPMVTRGGPKMLVWDCAVGTVLFLDI